MFFVFVSLFVFPRFVFVSPLLQNGIETKTAHGIAKTPFRSSPDLHLLRDNGGLKAANIVLEFGSAPRSRPARETGKVVLKGGEGEHNKNAKRR